jgi:hypothetical protein
MPIADRKMPTTNTNENTRFTIDIYLINQLNVKGLTPFFTSSGVGLFNLVDQFSQYLDAPFSLLSEGSPAADSNVIFEHARYGTYRTGKNGDLFLKRSSVYGCRIRLARKLHPQQRASCRNGEAGAGWKMLLDCQGRF